MTTADPYPWQSEFPARTSLFQPRLASSPAGLGWRKNVSARCMPSGELPPRLIVTRVISRDYCKRPRPDFLAIFSCAEVTITIGGQKVQRLSPLQVLADQHDAYVHDVGS